MNEKLLLQFLESHLSDEKRLKLNRVFLKYKSSSILKILSLEVHVYISATILYFILIIMKHKYLKCPIKTSNIIKN